MCGDAPNGIREAICAFANDLPGHGKPGVVIVGINDAGMLVGLSVTDELLRQLADMKTDGNITPPQSMAIQRHTLRDGDVVVVTVAPCDSPPTRYKGRIHVRTGPRRDIATAQDERILNERRLSSVVSFDVQRVETATLADLDLSYFEHEYLP